MKFNKNNIDYSLYLVTDRDLMSSSTLEEGVEAAINGGCTVVQLREKTVSSLEFYRTALSIKQICDAHGLPLIINDRLDIALAVGAAGVHLGQSDLPVDAARRILGDDKIIGASASNPALAVKAAKSGADYIGVGAMFPTGTKSDTTPTSSAVLREIIASTGLPVLAIGGVNLTTAPLLRGVPISGLAVVSAVLGAEDIEKAARELKAIFLSGQANLSAPGVRAPDKSAVLPAGSAAAFSGIKAAIFDLDGTLIDSMGVWGKIDADFLAKRGIALPDDYAAKLSALGFREAAEYTIERFGFQESADMLIDEWNAMAIDEYTHRIALKPHAKEYLMELKERGIKLGVATSLHPALYEAVLKNNGVYDYFDVICSTGEVARGKEFPDVFLRAAELMNTAPGSCLVFEDLLQAMRAAKLAGMKICGVFDASSNAHWEEIQRLADGVILDFKDAPRL